MSKTLLRPPEGTISFTFVYGCGKSHKVDGDIDCGPCVEHVRLMPLEERISRPDLRAPIVVAGDTPSEIDALRRAEEARRWAASWRLVEAEEPEPAEPASETPRTGEREHSPAWEAGRAAAYAGAPRSNPFDGRKLEGKDWAAGFDFAASFGRRQELPLERSR